MRIQDSRNKRKKALSNRDGAQPSTPLSQGYIEPKGCGKVNRVDARVQKLDLKRKGLPSSSRLIDDGDVVYIERNGKNTDGRKRKVKCRTPTEPRNRAPVNLGRIMSEFPLVRIRAKGPLSGYIARILQYKTDKSFKFLTKVQELLLGVTFESEFFYHACSPYLRGRAGKLLVSRKPSIGASRLILTQLLRIRSSFPWERLESIIDRD